MKQSEVINKPSLNLKSLFFLFNRLQFRLLRQHLHGFETEDARHPPEDSNPDLGWGHSQQKRFKEHPSKSKANPCQGIPEHPLPTQSHLAIDEFIRKEWFFTEIKAEVQSIAYDEVDGPHNERSNGEGDQHLPSPLLRVAEPLVGAFDGTPVHQHQVHGQYDPNQEVSDAFDHSLQSLLLRDQEGHERDQQRHQQVGVEWDVSRQGFVCDLDYLWGFGQLFSKFVCDCQHRRPEESQERQ